MTAQPGWYRDPSGQPGQRWFDGQDWTHHYAAPPMPQQQMMPQRESITMSGPNHAVHALITLFTCGLWAPVWLIIAVLDSKKVNVSRY